MSQKLIRVSVAAVVAAGAFVLAAGGGVSVAQEKKSIGDIMRAGHGKTDPLLGQVIAGVKGAKWEDAAKAAKVLDDNAALLGKATPKKGEAASWTDLTKKYHTNTSALVAAVDKKDAAGAKESVGALTSSCMECHMAHKGGKK